MDSFVDDDVLDVLENHIANKAEILMKAMFQTFGLVGTLVAIHNICCHGEAIEKYVGYETIPEDLLVKLFKGFDICLQAAREIRKTNE